MTAKTLLAGAGGAAVVVVVVMAVIWIVDSDTTQPAPARDKRATSLRECVALWNDPANSRQRAALNSAALLDPGGAPTAPGSVPLERRVLVLRYAGPPQEDVGVGESGVNASRGECMVVHPSNVLFLYTKAWHQVGYSPGLAFKGIPQRATSSPNAVMVIRKPATGTAVDAGRIALTR